MHNCGRRRDRPNERRLRTATNVHLRSRSGDEGSQGPHRPNAPPQPLSVQPSLQHDSFFRPLCLRRSPTNERNRDRDKSQDHAHNNKNSRLTTTICRVRGNACSHSSLRGCCTEADGKCGRQQHPGDAKPNGVHFCAPFLGWIEQARCESGPRNLTCARRGGWFPMRLRN